MKDALLFLFWGVFLLAVVLPTILAICVRSWVFILGVLLP
jgi:hypothetical protein